MNFTSPEFLIFFPIVLVLFYVIPARSRWVLLLAASWAFYLSWNPWTGILLLLATACSYAAGLGIERARRAEAGSSSGAAQGSDAGSSSGSAQGSDAANSPPAINFWSFIGIGVPLACLIVFKYAGFFANTTSSLLAQLGIQTNISLPRFVLPIGISFYTFQTLSYVIDVRRGTIPAERHFGFYALFVSFFPQLVAGPIERPGNLIPQLREVCGMREAGVDGTRNETTEQMQIVPAEIEKDATGPMQKESAELGKDAAEQVGREQDKIREDTAESVRREQYGAQTASARNENLTVGFMRILVGFFKKLVVADYLASFVDPVYGNPAAATPVAVLLATVLFAIQIYCDFSGYSDIACGAARMLGIDLTENFRLPYLAGSVREFWRRWHISLSSWLTDYIYIPLGGNRRGLARQIANVLLVFLLSGLWHGANVTFVVWGILHGGMVCAEILVSSRSGGTKAGQTHMGGTNVSSVVRRIITFAFVCFTWIFFRAGSLHDAGVLIGRVFSGLTAGAFAETVNLMGLTVGSVVHIVLVLWCLVMLDVRQEEMRQGVGKIREMGERRASYIGENRGTGERRASNSGEMLGFPESRALFTIIMVMTVAASWLMLLAEHAGNVFIYFQF